MDICIDFDGTAVSHEFPKVGNDIGSVPVLKKLVANGHRLILFTMRSDKESTNEHYLSDAVNWFKENGIPLFGINTNPEQKSWTSSPKAHAQLYIDDCALGIPLTYNPKVSGTYYVDWVKVEEWLMQTGVIRK